MSGRAGRAGRAKMKRRPQSADALGMRAEPGALARFNFGGSDRAAALLPLRTVVAAPIAAASPAVPPTARAALGLAALTPAFLAAGSAVAPKVGAVAPPALALAGMAGGTGGLAAARGEALAASAAAPAARALAVMAALAAPGAVAVAPGIVRGGVRHRRCRLRRAAEEALEPPDESSGGARCLGLRIAWSGRGGRTQALRGTLPAGRPAGTLAAVEVGPRLADFGRIRLRSFPA